jgi:hypothetical protein
LWFGHEAILFPVIICAELTADRRKKWISDGRLRELGFRLIYIERPDALCAEKRRELELWHNERLNPTCAVPWLTVTGALNEAEKLRQEDPENRELLSSLLGWLRARSPPAPATRSNGHRGRGPPQRITGNLILTHAHLIEMEDELGLASTGALPVFA